MSLLNISKKPISILKRSSISEVIKKLLEYNLSRLIVVEDGKSIGIITEKDVGLFLFSETTRQGLDDISITKIMKPILFVDESQSPEKSAKTMIENGVSSLTIGSDVELKGIFTKTDLVKYYLNNISDENKIVDYMTHDYINTHTAAPLFKVVRKMLEKKISRVIVKNQNENPVGVISFRNLFRISIELGDVEEDLEYATLDQIRKGFLSEEGFGNISLARDVMTKGLITIKFNQSLSDACKLILENNVSGLIVLDGNESIAGIISKTDIVKALASSK
ncbi:MAG: CBS domain-containing protein [Nitrosopumilus sp.]|nr:CBS domain-containing protein [Nitrosopumilus sp.]MDH3794730.1 CBS domain-containing protein [Nitrosopumilus sp.]MDH3855787.1 CBS domain-containing protein [Nitrosopumilus sp.]